MTLNGIILRYGIVMLSITISLVGFYLMAHWFSNTQWAIYGTILTFAQFAKEFVQMKLEKVLAREASREQYEIVLIVQSAALVVVATVFTVARGLGQEVFVALAATTIGISMSIIAIADFNLATRRARTYFLWKLYLPFSIFLWSFIVAHSGLRENQNAMAYAAVWSYCTTIAFTLAFTGLRYRHKRLLGNYLETLKGGLDIVKNDYVVVLMNAVFNAIAIGALSRSLGTEIMGELFKIQRGITLIGNNIQNVTRAIYMKYWHGVDPVPFHHVVRSSTIAMAGAIVLAALLRPSFFTLLSIDDQSTLIFWLFFVDSMLNLWVIRYTVPLTMQRRLEKVLHVMVAVSIVRLIYVVVPYTFNLWSATNGLFILLAMPIGSAISVAYLNRQSRQT